MVWREFGDRIARGDFDVVHRITPLSPTTPSRIAKRCKKAGVPFVVGPLNGSVPWPKTLRAAQHREGEFLSYVRSAYKLLPGYRGTRESPSAPFLKAGKMRLGIIGDGPEMERLGGLVGKLEVESSVELPGWIKHEEVQDRLVRSEVFAFPSVREFGGGVALEAMALGVVPVVLDYVGPSELVTDPSGRSRFPICQAPIPPDSGLVRPAGYPVNLLELLSLRA